MSINHKRAADRVVRQLNSLGIDERVGDRESHTARLVRAIVEAVLEEVVNHGEVVITNAQAATHVGPAKVTGKGDII